MLFYLFSCLKLSLDEKNVHLFSLASYNTIYYDYNSAVA